MASIYDITDAQVGYLLTVADLQRLSQLITTGTLNTAIQGLNGQLTAVLNAPTVQIAAGAIAIERQSKINVYRIDTTGGGLPTDSVNTVTWTDQVGAVFGEIYIFGIVSSGRKVTFQNGTFAVKNGEFQLSDLAAVIVFMVAPNGLLSEIARFPNVDTTETELGYTTAYVDGTDLTITSRMVKVFALGAETLAQGSITVDGGSVFPGTIQAWVSVPSVGDFIIGEYVSQSGDSEQDMANGLAASINTGTSYTAAGLGGAVCEVTAPVGTGAAANAYTLYSVVTGVSITTTDVNLGIVTLGVDGAEALGTVDTITGGGDGPIYLVNGMAAEYLVFNSGGNIEAGIGITLPPQKAVTFIKIGTTYYGQYALT